VSFFFGGLRNYWLLLTKSLAQFLINKEEETTDRYGAVQIITQTEKKGARELRELMQKGLFFSKDQRTEVACWQMGGDF